ncbi:MAG: hypothetical protein K6357_01145 [Elusimicrobiota bacterium]
MKNIFYIIPFLFLISCSGIKRNFWLNQFEVCCKIEKTLERDGQKLEFKDNFFEDDYLKLSAEFDIMEGIKLDITNKCGVNSYIYWDKAYYIDERGEKFNITISQLLFNEKSELSNISILPPFIDIKVNLIPQNYVYKEKNIWHNKTMLDFSFHPQEYLFKKTSLNFEYICGNITLRYLLSFGIVNKYSKD